MQLSSHKDPSGLIQNYLGHIRVGKRLAANTIDLYAQELIKLDELCNAQQLALTDVQNQHIRRWIASSHSSGKGPKTLALQLSSWRGFYKWLVAAGKMPHNPCLDVKPPKAAKPLPKALGVDAAVSLAQYDDQTNSVSRRDALIVELLYGCGLRVSELIGLDLVASNEAMTNGRGWIDKQAGEVHVFGKGSKRRMVPLGSKALEALSAYQPYRTELCRGNPLEPALLVSAKGVRLTRQAIWVLLRSRSLAAGLDQAVHPHMLRHSFASHVLQSSGDLRAVQELLGHSSIASTQVYTRLDFQHLAKIYDNSHPRAKITKASE